MIDSKLLLGERIFALYEPAFYSMVAALPVRIEAGLLAPEPSPAARIRTAAGGKSGLVAVIPVHGVIESRGGFFSMFYGGADCETLRDQIRQAVNDPAVAAMVLDIDSPGGDVAGIEELAQEIYNARKQKPITAVSNTLCASAAYYLGSQANELICSPSSLTGSIGVFTTHNDFSKALDNAGIKVSLIHYGENKAEDMPFQPLSDEARAHMQEMVDNYGQAFEKAVARGRSVSKDDVHKKFGQGRVYDAKKAVQLGMADRVGTFDDALAKHGASRPSGLRGVSATVWVDFAAAAERTKRVDGEDLPKADFAYQGGELTKDWHLPIKFSTDEKTKKHIRNAIARWSSTDMPDKDEKDKARGRIKAAARKYGIEVDDESLALGRCTIAGVVYAREQILAEVGDPDDDENDSGADDMPSDCACACAECKDDDCAACSCKDCACDGCACDAASKARKKKASAMQCELDLLAI